MTPKVMMMAAESSQPINFIEHLKGAHPLIMQAIIGFEASAQDLERLYPPLLLQPDRNNQAILARQTAELIAALSCQWFHEFYTKLDANPMDEATAKRTLCLFMQLRSTIETLFNATQPLAHNYFAYESELLKPFYDVINEWTFKQQWNTLESHERPAYLLGAFDTATLLRLFKQASDFLLDPTLPVVQNDTDADLLLQNSLYHSPYREALTNFWHLRLTEHVDNLFGWLRMSISFNLEQFSSLWHKKILHYKNHSSNSTTAHSKQNLFKVLDYCFLETFHEIFMNDQEPSQSIANLFLLFDRDPNAQEQTRLTYVFDMLTQYFPASLVREKYFPQPLKSALFNVLDFIAEKSHPQIAFPKKYLKLAPQSTTQIARKDRENAKKLSQKTENELKTALLSPRSFESDPLKRSIINFWAFYRVADYEPPLKNKLIKMFVMVSNECRSLLTKSLLTSKRYTTSTQQGERLWQTTTPEQTDTKTKALAVCRRYVNGDIDKFLGIFYWRSDASLRVMQHLITELEKPSNDLPVIFVKINTSIKTPDFKLAGRAYGILRAILQQMAQELTSPQSMIPTPPSNH